MTAIVPNSRPRLSAATALETAERLIVHDKAAHGGAILQDCPVMVLAVRGYYRDTMGKPRVNDFGIYDDAGFLIVGEEVFNFNWNCDPVRTGFNKDVGKAFAQLAPGVWPMRPGPHRGRPNHLRQLTMYEAHDERWDVADFFTDDRSNGHFQVRRCSTTTVFVTEWGYQAINVHEGTARGTGSWGCQTLPPNQWPEFQRLLYKGLAKYGQKWVPLVLTEDRVG